jgi:hypothetical protein
MYETLIEKFRRIWVEVIYFMLLVIIG